jgi:hypothetical protein
MSVVAPAAPPVSGSVKDVPPSHQKEQIGSPRRLPRVTAPGGSLL